MNLGILFNWDVAVVENGIPHVKEHRTEAVRDALVASSKGTLIVHLVGSVANLYVVDWLCCRCWNIV
jgi:hypothetical protein